MEVVSPFTVCRFSQKPSDKAMKMLESTFHANGAKLAWLVGHLLGERIQSVDEITNEHWFRIYKETYPGWRVGDFSVRDPEVEAIISDLHGVYEAVFEEELPNESYLP